jgi:Zn-dependent protease with chaperone function
MLLNILLLILQFALDYILLSCYIFFFYSLAAMILPPSSMASLNSSPLLQSSGLSLCLIVPALLSRFPFFQRFLIYLMGVRKPKGTERDIMEAAAAPIFARANLNEEDFHLYIDNKKQLNAYAIGDNNIVVTRPVLSVLPIPEISGIMAHEMGHLQHHHTRWLLLSYGMSMPLAVSNYLYRIIVTILSFFLAVPILGFLIALFVFVFNVLIRITNACMGFPIRMLELYHSRQNEYEADRYACSIGLGAELYNALSAITQNGAYEQTGFFATLFSDHPLTRDRLERLAEMVQNGVGE